MQNDTALLSLLPSLPHPLQTLQHHLHLHLPSVALLKQLGRSALEGLGLSLYSNFTYGNASLPMADDAGAAGALGIGRGAAAGAGGIGARGGGGGDGGGVLGGTGAGFWTSKWALSNILMPILLYRIQHLPIPRSRLRRALRRFPPPLWSLLLPRPFPINPRRARTRLLLRLPTLWLMLRSWLVLGVMLAQAGGFYPVPTASAGAAAGSHAWLGHALAALGLWVGKMKFDDACWSAYKAVCCAMLVGTFLGNLEGRMGGEVSFNLFPFAMLLYTHCSLVPSLLRPSAAAADPAAMQPRPSAHAVLTILMPFSLMLALHVMGVSRRWAGRKLLPGAVFGLLGQAHFLYVITHQIRAYPAFSFLGGILELLFLLAILLSLLLRALTQLLLDGSLSPSILGHPAGLPGWEDDWGVAVLKLAQAGLYDLSRRAGLANELVELNEQAREPEVHLSKTRAELLLPALPSSSVPGSGQARAPQFGFNREIRSIKVRADAERAGGVYGFSELARASWRLLRTVGAVARGVHRRWILKPHEPAGEGEGEGVEREGRGALSGAGVEGGVGGGSGEGVDAEGEEERVWRRFLQGVEEDEDEDEDWRADGTDEDEEGEEDDSEGADPARDGQSADEGADVREEYPLYSDLLQPLASLDQPDPAALSLAPVLVAHLTSPHALTRRRYQALMLHPPDTSASSDPNAADTAEWRAFLAQRRSERSQAQVDWARSSETALMCAVCMSEPRAVVCWPCRCLAMCDECRAGIAARFVLRGQHTCPCCRQTVDGYSRIYIP